MPLRRSLTATACLVALGLGGSAAYTVRPGDTLSGIAARLGVGVSQLAQANGIADPDRVLAGAVLQLPGGTAAASPTEGSHTVVAGDTLSGIAARHGVSVASLVAANGLRDQHLIRIGTRLVVPGGGGPAPTTASSALPERLRQSPERLALIPRFQHWAGANGIPADLLMALTWLESGWQNHVVSSAGAQGIGQLMPATVDFTRDHLIGVRTLDPAVPEDNIRMSARYLRWLLVRADGDVRKALAGYYQGPFSVQLFGPYPGTVRYVDDVLALRARFPS